MRTKIIISLVVLVTTINSFAQKQNEKPLYTLCGKSGDCKMTLDEFKKCKKELTPIDKNLKIISFNVSLRVISEDRKDSLFVDQQNTGNVFSAKTNDMIEKFITEKKLIDIILIEQVQVSEGEKKSKATGMVIKIKYETADYSVRKNGNNIYESCFSTAVLRHCSQTAA